MPTNMLRWTILLPAALLVLWFAAPGLGRGAGGAIPEERIARVAASVSEIRGLEFERLPRAEYRSRKELRALLREVLSRDAGFERLVGLIEVERRLGLIPQDFVGDPVEIWLDAYTMLRDGCYDDRTGTVFLAGRDRLGTFADDIILARELVHVLRDQRREMAGYFHPETLTSDELAYRLAIADGEATLVEFEYASRALRKLLSSLPRMGNDLRADGAPPPEVPDRSGLIELAAGDLPLDESPLAFGYIAGARFLDAVEREGGWEAVDALLAGSDLTSEIVLHPAKLAEPRDLPTRVELPNLAGLLPGWRLLLADTLGELGIRAILAATLSGSDAAAASVGWDGDRLLVYEAESGAGVGMVWALTFDSDRDAAQFGAAWGRLVEERPALRGRCHVEGRDVLIVAGFPEPLTERAELRASGFATWVREDDRGRAQADAATSRIAEDEAVAAATERRGPREGGVQVLESEQVGLVVRVPEDWDVRGAVEMPTLRHRGTGAGVLLRRVPPGGWPKALDDVSSELGSHGAVRVRDQGEVRIAGRLATWTCFAGTGEGGAPEFRVRVFGIPASDGHRLLALVCPAVHEDRALAAFVPILDSLAVLEASAKEDRFEVTLRRRKGEEETTVRWGDRDWMPIDDAMRELVTDLASAKEKGPVAGSIHAWARVPHSEVIRAIDAFMSAGINDITFMGAPPPRLQPDREEQPRIPARPR